MDYQSHIPREQLGEDKKKILFAILAEPDPSYNPLAFPPDVDLAKDHGNATRVCKPYIPENTGLCKCCGKPILNEQLDIFCRFEELNHLGISYPLYYYFKRSTCIMLLLAFLISGIYQIKSNAQQSAWVTEYQVSSLDAYSVIGYYLDPTANNFLAQTGVIFAANFVIFFLLQYFKGQQKKMVWDAHSNTESPADYTVLVSGLDELGYTEAELLDFFNNRLNMHHFDPLEVKKIGLTYDIKDLDDLHRKRAKLIHERRKLDSKLNYHGNSEISRTLADKAEDLDAQIAQCEKSLEDLEKDYFATSNFFRLSGSVFVTLNTQKQSKDLQKRFKMRPLKRFLVSAFGCVFKNFAYKDRVLHVERAPQPSDVLFENLSVSAWTKLGKTIKSYIMTFITIVISTLILFGISFWKTYEYKSLGKTGTTGNTTFMVLSYAASFVVVIINQILITVIKKFCADEHHYSYTHFYRSIARKLVVAQFINTALVPLLVRLVLAYYFSDKINDFNNPTPNNPLDFVYLLANDMIPIFEINAISTPLLYLFDTTYFLRLCKRRSLVKNPATTQLSQCEANTLFEGPALDIASRYAGFVKTIWAAAFYSFLIPLAVPISLVGLYLGYLIDRYLLARRFSTPIQLGKDLSKAMAGYIKEWIFFSALGNLLFGAYFFNLANPGILDTDPIAAFTVSTIILGFINMIVRFKIYRIFVKKNHVLSKITWEDVHLEFYSDYDRANPVTQAVAEEQVLREALQKETDPQRRSIFMNLLGKIQVRNSMEKSHIQGLYKYAATHQNLGDHYNEHNEGHVARPNYDPQAGVMGFSKRLSKVVGGNGNVGPFPGINLTTSNFVPNPGAIGFAPVNAYGNNVVIQENVQPQHHHHHKHNNNY